MKPEPFKEIRLHEVNLRLAEEGFSEEDIDMINVAVVVGIMDRLYKDRIKSAVGWLKEEVNKLLHKYPDTDIGFYTIIEEAFKSVKKWE